MPNALQIKSNLADDEIVHITSRGVGNLKPFMRVIDKREFLGRFPRYQSPDRYVDASRRPYEKLHDEVLLMAFCILDNHYHLILRQLRAAGVERLMRRVLTGYGRYHRYETGWRGPISDGRYAAKPIRSSDHLREALSYTILNDPIDQLDHDFSSHAWMLGQRNSNWLRTDLALAAYGGVEGYREHMNRTGPARVASKLKRWGIDPKLHPYRSF